jgi:hypothetical protein
MRLPCLNTDGWELRSGEAAHSAHPDTFWMPPLEERQNLKIGQAARLIFDIEVEDEQGDIVMRAVLARGAHGASAGHRVRTRGATSGMVHKSTSNLC